MANSPVLSSCLGFALLQEKEFKQLNLGNNDSPVLAFGMHTNLTKHQPLSDDLNIITARLQNFSEHN